MYSAYIHDSAAHLITGLTPTIHVCDAVLCGSLGCCINAMCTTVCRMTVKSVNLDNGEDLPHKVQRSKESNGACRG